MRASAIYEGTVYHERTGPRRHAFRKRLCLFYLDLQELPELFRGRWFWSASGRSLAWFRRADYLGPEGKPLGEAVLDRVEGALDYRPRGPVRMLSQLRAWGYLFNPVTFYYCFGPSEELEAVVAEITNTPWKQRFAYVLDARGKSSDELRWSFDKSFHVSPFFDMDQVYDWSFGAPGPELSVHMKNREGGEVVFQAGMRCQRREITAGSLARALVRYPFQTLRVHAAIYWQAARLYLKRTPFFVHPDKRAPLRDATPS